MITKNIDATLFTQLKQVDFGYLVQLNGLIGDYVEINGADCLDSELVIFDITLNNVVKERIEELIHAEEGVKEIGAEERETNTKVSYVKEAREYLESLFGMFNGKIIDHKCLEIIEN